MLFTGKSATAVAACFMASALFYPCQSSALEPPTVTPIHQIQGADLLSPLNNNALMTEGVVTAVVSDGYYLQTIVGSDDGNPATSQGLFVFTGSPPAIEIVSGAKVQVTGTVEEYRPANEPHQLTFTRLKDISNTVIVSIGNALPSATTLTDTDLNDANSIDWMERYEGMRVNVSQLRVMQPVGGVLDEINGVATLDNIFYGVLPAMSRPAREPGIGITESIVIPPGKSIPFFDNNPENLRVDSSRLTGPAALSPDYRDIVNNLSGVLEYKDGTPSLLALPDASTNVTLGSYAFQIGDARVDELSLATYNLDRLFDDVDDPAITEPVLSTDTLENRLTKLSNSVCHYIRTPHVLAVYEVENLGTLQALADKINTNNYACFGSPVYTAHLVESNDPTGLDIGLLVSESLRTNGNKRVEILSIGQVENTTTFLNPSSTAELLFSRAPLLVKIRANHNNGNFIELTLVLADFLSAEEINSPASGNEGWPTMGEYVRKKRAAQALTLAQFIESLQIANPDEKIVLLGNFNAEKFSDGYVDVMGIVTGRETLEESAIEYVNSPITLPLTNLSTLSEQPDTANGPEDQNTSISGGDTRRLEHIVLNHKTLSDFSATWGVPRANASFGLDLMYDTSVMVRASRYEPTVAYLLTDDFKSIDLEASGFPEFNNPSPDVPNQYILSSLVTNHYNFYVFSYGESAADDVVIDITSSLTPGQWFLSYKDAPSLTCTPISATAAGSMMSCSISALGGNGLQGVRLITEIPANPSLENAIATMDMNVRHLGGGTDYDLSNNTSSKSILFKSATDLSVESVNHATPVLAGSGSGLGFRIRQLSINPPGSVTLRVTVNTLPSEAYIGTSDYNGTWTCDSGVAQANGTSLFTCTTSNFISSADYNYFSLNIRGDLGNGGKIYDISVDVASTATDENLQNNQLSASISVLDDTELSAVASRLSGEPIRLHQTANFNFLVGNVFPSIARNAKVELVFDALPQDVSPLNGSNYYVNDSHRDPVWTCGSAQAYNGNQSRVICSGTLTHVQTPQYNFTGWTFQAKVTPRLVPGQATNSITARVNVYSDSIDTNPSNNTSIATQTVNQTTDLVLGRITVNGIGNPVQVIEPEEIVYSISPSYDMFSQTINIPINTRMSYVLDFIVNDHNVQVFKGTPANRIAMACSVVPNPATGRTAIDCPETLLALSEYATVIVDTGYVMHDRTITLTATGTNDLVDINPANNSISISTLVKAKADLCVSPSDLYPDSSNCNGIAYSLPSRLVAGDKQLFTLKYRNLGPSVAMNTKVKIRAGIAPARLTARMNEQAPCGLAVAVNANESEVICDVGIVLADVINTIQFWIDTAGEVNGRTLAYKVTFTTDTEDTNPANNIYTTTIPVIPVIDLSSQVLTKGDNGSYLVSQDFYIVADINGPATGSSSQMKIVTSAPGAFTYPQIIAAEWSCSLTGGGFTDSTYACNANSPLVSGVNDRIVLRFQPNKMQTGKAISVSSEHVYPGGALAIDRTPGNNSGSASRVITGQRLMEGTLPLKPAPTIKPKPPSTYRQPVETKRKSPVH